jgi:indolepyruvate ferredoxin oxidoreductase alpha subunit
MVNGFFLGNELIALAAVNSGVKSAYAYPGTPSSEILSAFQKFAPERYAQWSLNEKIALELAAGEAISGASTLCCMKMVGLNVAADPLFSVAYTGVDGAMVLVSADDPGPYSSQTEQDSRMYAVSAKMPVLDPCNPQDAYRLTILAYQISEKYKLPVMVRPVMRVCHSRQNFEAGDGSTQQGRETVMHGTFRKDMPRWAATPKFRRILHEKLNKNLDFLAAELAPKIPEKRYDMAVVASGYAYAMAKDVIEEMNLPFDIIKVDMPFPLDRQFVIEAELVYDRIVVLEETFPVIEHNFTIKTVGRLTGLVPSEGELTADIIADILLKTAGITRETAKAEITVNEEPVNLKPRLCAGCGHRPAFFAMKLAAPDGIFPGDIGCYTLGVNLNAVDTCICMGASITFAEALKRSNPEKPVICTIGDSTFFHTGVAGLTNAVVNSAPIVVAILDNETTAMTGFQPVPHKTGKLTIEMACQGAGVKHILKVDPYNLKKGVEALKQSLAYAHTDSAPAVVIFTKECVTKVRYKNKKIAEVADNCTDCTICYEKFECPAIYRDKAKRMAKIDESACVGCMVCIQVCPQKAIGVKK